MISLHSFQSVLGISEELAKKYEALVMEDRYGRPVYLY